MRIEDNELIKQEHFPVKAVFNMISDKEFVEVITSLCHGEGWGGDYGSCVFWNDLDDYDKTQTPKYDGAEFGLHNGEEITISLPELLSYIKLVVNKYVKEYPNCQTELADNITFLENMI